jgi:hypothetical protein
MHTGNAIWYGNFIWKHFKIMSIFDNKKQLYKLTYTRNPTKITIISSCYVPWLGVAHIFNAEWFLVWTISCLGSKSTNKMASTMKLFRDKFLFISVFLSQFAATVRTNHSWKRTKYTIVLSQKFWGQKLQQRSSKRVEITTDFVSLPWRPCFRC